MSNGLWIILWAIFLSAVVCIFLWAASRKPVEQAQDPFNNACEQAHRQMPLRQEPSPRSYLADIYPVLGEYPKPLTGIQKEAEAGTYGAVERTPTYTKENLKEFMAGSTAAPKFKLEMTGFRAMDEAVKEKIQVLKAPRPSAKSRTPVAKKAPAKKADKPVAKKRATKRATNKA